MELYHDQTKKADEAWMDIPEYVGYYQASNYGRIRSVAREISQKGHKNNYKRILKGKILRPRLQNSNYYIVWLSKDGEIKAQLIHRLVAQTFISNINNEPCINHKNGNKADNRIENLEWCNYSENIKHSYTILERKKISKPVICIELNQEFPSIINASYETKINRHSISHALNGYSKTAGGFTWKFI